MGISINDHCENSGTCAMVCPEDCFEHENGTTRVINAAACTNCWICADNCTTGAIELD